MAKEKTKTISAHPPTRRLDTNEAAEYLGLSPKTLRNSRHSGMLAGESAPPYRKLGVKCVYDQTDLESWLDQFERQTSTSAHGASAESAAA